jgi:5'-nucleotidase
MRPLVLLANDDGFRAQGLNALRQALLPTCDVVVCAPHAEQSASSHALTLHRPLRLAEDAPGIFSVDGTPADAVYVALHSSSRLLPRRPDAVVSGVNHGVNLGDDVFYSGTVAAAREAALKGLPTLAVSAAPDVSFESAAALGAELLHALVESKTGPILLNVNVPPGEGWKIRATRLGRRIYTDEVEYRRDPRGREYLWLGGKCVEHRPLAGSDTEAFDEGVVGVTPLVLDLWAQAQGEQADSVVEMLGELRRPRGRTDQR